jgi:superfamily I DNA and/or RNA helicase
MAVAWITTRYLPERREQAAEPSYVNSVEVERILDLLGEFENALDSGEEKVTVQILSGYAAQAQLLERSIDRARHGFPHLIIECNTIHTVQGREADLVVLSVTRSNSDLRAGFLKELALTNVALSRARETLVIVGDDEFVRRAPGAEPLQRVLRHIEKYPDECVLRSFDPPDGPKGFHR